MEVLGDNDTLRCVTNFYVSPSMLETKFGGNSKHGKNRYDSLRIYLKEYNYKVTFAEGLGLLQKVAQGPNDDKSSTGFTQWSEMYNLTKRRLTMNLTREWNKTFEYGVE